MERRKALTIAGTAAMVMAAGGFAMAANFGMLGVAGAGDDTVGTLDAGMLVGEAQPSTTTTATPQVIVVDQYDVPAGVTGDPAPGAAGDTRTSDDAAAPPAASAAPAPAPAVPTPTPSPSVGSSSDRSDDGSYEHEDEHESEHEHESEYEDEHDDD